MFFSIVIKATKIMQNLAYNGKFVFQNVSF